MKLIIALILLSISLSSFATLKTTNPVTIEAGEVSEYCICSYEVNSEAGFINVMYEGKHEGKQVMTNVMAIEGVQYLEVMNASSDASKNIDKNMSNLLYQKLQEHLNVSGTID